MIPMSLHGMIFVRLRNMIPMYLHGMIFVRLRDMIPIQLTDVNTIFIKSLQKFMKQIILQSFTITFEQSLKLSLFLDNYGFKKATLEKTTPIQIRLPQRRQLRYL